MPSPALRIHSPTPATTAYTIANAPPLTSRVSRLVHYSFLSLRAAVALVCVLLLFVQITAFLAEESGVVVLDTLAELEADRYLWWQRRDDALDYGREFSRSLRIRAGDGTGFWAPVFVCGMVLWVLSRRGHVEESLLALRSLGLQTSTSSHSLFSAPTTRFIPTSQIQDIFIHEAFIGFSVKFYLAVIVEGEEEAVVVFPKLLPRRALLEQVWRGAREVLWGAGGNPRNSKREGETLKDVER